MMLAGILAFVVISVLMIVLFRLPGVVAVISLAGQVGLCMAAISGYFPFLNSYTTTCRAWRALCSPLAWAWTPT